MRWVADGETIAESFSRASPVSQGVRASKTPAGVWVIVGMAVFFAIGGLGVSASSSGKQLAIQRRCRWCMNLASKKFVRCRVLAACLPGKSEWNIRARIPIDDAGPAPPVVNDRAEEDQMRQEVLKRIDLMRVSTDGDKDKLYVQVERARGFTKIAIVPFTQNRSIAGAAQVDGLIKSLSRPDLRKLLADPTVVLIMVGYADKKGEEAKNLDISRSRAESVVKALREKTELVNMMHAVGMGGQELFDQSDLEKNRVVEVWAVQP